MCTFMHTYAWNQVIHLALVYRCMIANTANHEGKPPAPIELESTCICDVYVHIHMHTYINTHTHTHIHTYRSYRSYIHTHIHAYIHICIHTCLPTYIHTYMHTYINIGPSVTKHTYISIFPATKHLQYMKSFSATKLPFGRRGTCLDTSCIDRCVDLTGKLLYVHIFVLVSSMFVSLPE